MNKFAGFTVHQLVIITITIALHKFLQLKKNHGHIKFVLQTVEKNSLFLATFQKFTNGWQPRFSCQSILLPLVGLAVIILICMARFRKYGMLHKDQPV